jgi:diadenosine tetraphosphate (Ap4A) HIT family hydrolase
MSALPDPLYCLEAARSSEQRLYMEGLAEAGICIFCPEHVAGQQREPIEHSGRHWYVKKNDYPYEGALAHYLIVSQAHVLSFDELPDEAGAELWAIKRALKSQLQPAAFATVERSGNMLYNGGSVAHLHVHLVALGATPAATVRFRVSAHAGSEPEPLRRPR